MTRSSTLLLACMLLWPSPVPSTETVRAQTGAEGTLFVYLQPQRSGGAPVDFSIDAVSAVSSQGPASSLDVALKTVRRADAGRQRLMASGRIPEGSYSGLSLRLGRARVRSDRGEADLLVPDHPVPVAIPFGLPRGGAAVLWVDVRMDDAPSRTTFEPEFTAYVAPRPIASLAGFVSVPKANAVVAFDKKRRLAAAVVPTGNQPAGMALDQRAARLYVACPREGEVLALDVAGAAVVERARGFPGDDAREIALTPDGRTLLSANRGSNSVSVFDTAPLTRLERIEVGSGPASLAIDPTGRRAFVFDTLSSTISVIDIGTRAVVATISTDAAPVRGQFSARGDRLYVVHERTPYLTVIDPLQLTIATRARLRGRAGAIKVDGRRGLLYVGGPDDDRVEFYDPNTLLPINSLATRGGVSFLAADGEENVLYLVSPETDTLMIGGLAERKLVSEIDVGGPPYWVAVMGER